MLGLTSLKSLQINRFSFDGEHLKDISTSLQVFSTTGSKITNTTALFENINKRSKLEKLFISDCWIPVSSTQSLELPTLKHLSLIIYIQTHFGKPIGHLFLKHYFSQFTVFVFEQCLGEITPKKY
ncbi:MAG: hypothetical protein R2822_10880 [Spirosomataceae bacterium]